MSAAIASLTTALARPVTRGLLPEAHAQAAIAAALARSLPIECDFDGELSSWLHILDLHIHKFEIRRDDATGAIKRVLRPLIAARKSWNVLMAEAHDVNGATDFPLTEPEVAEIVKQEVWWSLPPAPRRQTHGR